jgi:hypothetical protein
VTTHDTTVPGVASELTLVGESSVGAEAIAVEFPAVAGEPGEMATAHG